MTKEAEIKELEDKIRVLKELPGESEKELVAGYEKQLAELKGQEEKEVKGMTEEVVEGEVIEIPATEEDWERSASKFASVGEHLSEMGMPYWKAKGKSIGFPFTITADGPDKNKKSELFAGVSVDALFKIKEILFAVGVKHKVVAGKIQFSPTECAGKPFLSVWTPAKDTRTPEEGGTGATYAKPTGALPIGAKTEDLGI